MIHLTNCHGELTALLSALPALAYIVALWTRRTRNIEPKDTPTGQDT